MRLIAHKQTRYGGLLDWPAIVIHLTLAAMGQAYKKAWLALRGKILKLRRCGG